jgi:hypothetical protein
MSDIVISNDDQLNEIRRQMAERLKAQRLETTDRSKVRAIPIGRDRTGAVVMGDYVPHYEAQKWLDEKYPGWSWEVLPESFREYGGMVILAGRLTVYEPEGIKSGL